MKKKHVSIECSRTLFMVTIQILMEQIDSVTVWKEKFICRVGSLQKQFSDNTYNPDFDSMTINKKFALVSLNKFVVFHWDVVSRHHWSRYWKAMFRISYKINKSMWKLFFVFPDCQVSDPRIKGMISNLSFYACRGFNCEFVGGNQTCS